MTMIYNGTEVVTAKDIRNAIGINSTHDFMWFCKKHHWNPSHTVLSGAELEQFKGIYPNSTKSWCIGLYPKKVLDEAVSLAGIIASPKESRGETMSSLMAGIIAESPEFGKVRVVRDENGECYMVASDVASALQYEVPADAVAKHIDSDDKFTLKSKDKSMVIQNMRIAYNSVITGSVSFDVPPRGFTVINESGMYALIFRSKLPSAQRFKHWVTSEVLPSIRKTGGYHDVDRMQSQLDSMKEAMDRIERTTKNLWLAMGARSAATKHIIEMY